MSFARRSMAPLPVCLALVALIIAADAHAREKASGAGRTRVTFAERSPLTEPDEVFRRCEWQTGHSTRRAVGDDEKASVGYDIGGRPFDVVVPPRYEAGTPHGLFVWIGQGDVQDAWLPVLARHKLILTTPVEVQKASIEVRAALAVDAVHNLSKSYDLDPRRIYIAGFSAGGHAATCVLRAYPEVFSGGCFLMGGDFYNCRSTTGATFEPSAEPSGPAWHGSLDQIKQDAKLVLMRGARDADTWKAAGGRANAESLRLDGFTRVSYTEVPNWPHQPPSEPWFERAIVALEAKPKRAPTTAPTTAPRPEPSQVAQARRLLVAAESHVARGKQMRATKQAAAEKAAAAQTTAGERLLRQVLRDFPTTPSAERARKLLSQLGSPAATRPAQTQD